MAVSYEATHSHNGSDVEDTSFSVTIPASANCVVVYAIGGVGSIDSSAKVLDELCWDGGSTMDFTHVATCYYATNNPVISCWYMTSADGNWPGTGSKTLYYRTYNNNTINEGIHVIVLNFSGVDTADPLVDTDDTGSDLISIDWTSTMTGVGAGDMGVIGIYEYQVAGDGNDNAQTEVANGVYNGSGYSAAYKLAEDGMFSNVQSSYMGAVALALNASAAGGGLSIPVAMSNYLRQMGV